MNFSRLPFKTDKTEQIPIQNQPQTYNLDYLKPNFNCSYNIDHIVLPILNCHTPMPYIFIKTFPETSFFILFQVFVGRYNQKAYF